MPLYAFDCVGCGLYEVWRSLAEYNSPSWCPACRGPGRRLYTPPGLVRTPSHVRQARTLEEKSANEPEVVQGPLPGRPLRPPGYTSPTWATPRRGRPGSPLSRL